MRRRRLQPVAIIAVLVAIAVLQIFNRREPAPSVARVSPPAPVSSPSPAVPAETSSAVEDTRAARLDAIDPAERPQVERTLALIARGGPFLHRQDGSVFSNRERRLPEKPGGYYREYTVETPGANTRGARRIVRGAGGETYYTNDHYTTFVRLE